MSLVTFPRQFLVDINGTPRVGAKATFYQAGTSTTLVTVYTTGAYDVPHQNPVESVAGGLFPAVYVNPAVNPTYKLLITDSVDVPIPGYPEDNIPALGFTQADIGATLYPRTAAEIAAGVTPVNFAYQPGDVRRYGAVGDGVTDNTAAIQDAIDAAGVAGEVIFPAIGVYLCAGSLTGLNFQTWRGKYYELGAGGAQAAIKSSITTEDYFITTGANQRFENLRFLGVASYSEVTGDTSGSLCTAIKLTDSVTFRDCVFRSQFHCVENTGASATYIRMYGGQVDRCAVFLNMRDADVYNFQIDGTIFTFCSTITSSNDTPKRYVNNLKMMGGSVELFTSAFNVLLSASFFGTYFENNHFDGAFGFNSDGNFVDGTSLSFFGCLVFLNHMDRFINYAGLTNATLVSIGNVIASAENTGEDQNYFVPQDSGGRVVMIGDYLDDRGSGTFQGNYISNVELVRNQLIVWPRGTTADHANAGQTWIDGGIISKPVTLAVDSAPSIAGGSIFLTGGAATITDFVGGVEGQIIRLVAEHAVTITDGTNIFLSGSTNFVMAATDTLTLLCKADGNWYELGRSDNT